MARTARLVSRFSDAEHQGPRIRIRRAGPGGRRTTRFLYARVFGRIVAIHGIAATISASRYSSESVFKARKRLCSAATTIVLRRVIGCDEYLYGGAPPREDVLLRSAAPTRNPHSCAPRRDARVGVISGRAPWSVSEPEKENVQALASAGGGGKNRFRTSRFRFASARRQ